MAATTPNIGWTLDRAVRLNSNAVATIDIGTGERRTWSETKRRVDGLATALTTVELGASQLERGDRVGVLCFNGSRHFETWFAIPAAGMVMNDLNYRLAVEELAFIANDSNVRVLFVDDALLDVGRQLIERCDELEALVWMGVGETAPEGTTAFDALAATTPAELPEPAHDDLAAIFYTGGTTGLPKGAMLTHQNLTANASHMVASAQMTMADRYLHAAPQFHLADGACTFATTWVGGSHVFLPQFTPAGTIAAIADEQVTAALLVPTMIGMVVADGGLASANIDALRLIMYGASPMPGEVQRQAAAAFGCDFAQAYGMTECAPLVTWHGPEEHRRGLAGEEPWATRLRSAGNPTIGMRVEVRREDGSIADAGEAGEIYIQGPNVMLGYWNRAEETEHALGSGWYRSGDVAYGDEDGYLFIVDRAKDMIISGGENIYTSEVENAVYSFAGVLEAAVFGVPSEQWGETVHVDVVPKPGVTIDPDALIEHCRGLIAGYKLPRSVHVRASDDALPKSGAGKILKRDLREPHWEGHEARVS